MKFWLCSLLAGLFAVPAQGSPCQVCVRPVRVQKVFAQQVVVPLQAPVYHQVGLHLQQQAQAVADFRLSQEYTEYLELKGYYKAHAQQLQLEQMRMSLMQQQQEQAPPEEVPTPEEGHLPRPDHTQPEQPVGTQDEFVNRYPTIAAKCMKCHTTDSPPGNLWLDGSVAMDGVQEADYARRALIMEVIHSEYMPKNGPPLTPQEKFDLAVELFAGIPHLPQPGTPPVPTPAP